MTTRAVPSASPGQTPSTRSKQVAGVAAQSTPRRFTLDKRYLAPILVTFVLVAGQVTFGFLESWSRTFLAIAMAMGVELVVSRLLFGQWPHLASAYISGISVGMLI